MNKWLQPMYCWIYNPIKMKLVVSIISRVPQQKRSQAVQATVASLVWLVGILAGPSQDQVQFSDGY